MAITVDQFLRDLTERQLLSGEEASAFRRELTPPTRDAAPQVAAVKSASAASAMTQIAPAPEASPLVLCNCLLKERIQDGENHLVFQAQHLQKDSAVSVHVLMPRGLPENRPFPSPRNGETAEADSISSAAVAILDVGRHGEMVCISCQAIEADSLAEIVHQHEKLPWDLATESLLQTVKTLKRMQNQGLRLNSISAEHLLLDEEGQIHLTGENPAEMLGGSWRLSEKTAPPSVSLLKSLGGLYQFLQTGQPDQSPAELFADDAGFPSARLIYERLTGINPSPPYASWDPLIRDLEALLDGQDLTPPLSEPAANIPAHPSLAHPATSATAARASSPTPATGRWVAIGLALLGGIVIASLALLNQ